MDHRRLVQALLAVVFLAGCAIQPTPAQLPALENTPTPTSSRTPTNRIAAAPSPTPRVPTRAAQSLTPTRTPIRPTLPASALVKGMYGYGQLFPLSCEARSAADWARHFGITIHELDFLGKLPKSKNPEEGFVGSLNGGWGQVPPDAYGVHAGPIALILKGYGAKAKAVRNLPYEQVRAEITAGRPVIVWVTGHVAPGKGIVYKIDGKSITVAPYEHTVIVIGYDEKRVTILDGKTIYQRAVDTFLQSWQALDNMAIVWEEKAN
jgi:uncharacterized protein YvpB